MAKKPPKFKATASEGKIVWTKDVALQVKKHLCKFEGKAVEITIARPTKQRSTQENRYYWGVVVQDIADYTGYEPDEMHEILRAMFLTSQADLVLESGCGFNMREDGEIIKVPKPKSTKELSTVKFEEYLSKVRRWASMELSLYIPLPNEAGY